MDSQNTPPSPLKTKNKHLFIAGVFLVIGFLGGFFYNNFQAGPTLGGFRPLENKELGKPETVDFSIFWHAWNTLQEKYIDRNDIDTQALVYGAIEGMVNSLGDPFTNFLDPEIGKRFEQDLEGSFGGVGIEIGVRDDRLTVIAPLKDSPAFKVGLQAGDIIIKIDDTETIDLSLQKSIDLIRGRRGTRVTLTIAREDAPETLEFEIVRDQIEIPSVELEFVGENKSIAHLQIFSFNQKVDNDFKEVAREILRSGADRIILDVRNNPGGLLDSAVNIASWFLPEGQPVVIERFGDGQETVIKSGNIGSLKHLPLVILTNKGSASASEILAGALRDNRNIKIVGEKTFGKGSVQSLFELDNNGSKLKVTIAEWLTPNRSSIHNNGIEPTLVVERTLEDIQNDRDPQLESAIDLIKNL